MIFQPWKWQCIARLWLVVIYFVLMCALTYYEGVILGIISPLIGFMAATQVNTRKLKDWKTSVPKLSKSLLHIITYLLMINGSIISMNKNYDNTNIKTTIAKVHRDQFAEEIDGKNIDVLKNFVQRNEFEKMIQDLKLEINLGSSKSEDSLMNEDDGSLKNFALYNESAWLVEYPDPGHVASLYFLNFKLPWFLVDFKSDPSVLLQPDNSFLFSFLGSKGSFVIGLSEEIKVKKLSITHLDTEQLSKPKDISVLGSEHLQSWIHLSSFTYDLNSEQTQHFVVQNQLAYSHTKFRYVKIIIQNNWGDIDYTTLSNIAVYG